jgi:hypothetical protein
VARLRLITLGGFFEENIRLNVSLFENIPLGNDCGIVPSPAKPLACTPLNNKVTWKFKH